MEVLQYTIDDVTNIRRYYDVDEKQIEDSVEILKKWIQQQKHLPKNQDDGFIERFLLRNKFRIEKTKLKLEAYYSLKGVFKQYYQKNNEEFVPSKEVALALPFPRLTPKWERFVLMRLENFDPQLYDAVRAIKYTVVLLEILIRNDYSIGDRILMDLKGMSMGHLKKMSVAELSKLYILYSSVYPGRPLSLDMVNAPPFLNVLLGLCKLALPEKIFLKIRVHKCYDDLHQWYPKNCLPSDYGGDLESVEELKKKWDIVFDNNRKMLNENYHNVSAEHLRVGELPKGGYFGVDGTFKKLNID